MKMNQNEGFLEGDDWLGPGPSWVIPDGPWWSMMVIPTYELKVQSSYAYFWKSLR